MSKPTKLVPVKEIRTGNRLVLDGEHIWTAEADAEELQFEPGVMVVVRYADGGAAERTWDDPDHQLLIERDT